MRTYFEVAALAYLLGTIPFGYILVRLFRGQDIRSSGSGNIGATNVARSAPGLGVATLVLDAAKGYLAVFAALQLVARSADAYLAPAVAALFVILGHMYPVWLKFKGGKGVATGVGAFLALAPLAVAIVLAVFLAVVVVSRYVSLGSILATAAFPVCVYVLYRGNQAPGVLLIVIACAALIIAKHHQNIRRLLTGTESRFQLKKGAGA